jgi:hypothetical protein
MITNESIAATMSPIIGKPELRLLQPMAPPMQRRISKKPVLFTVP